MKYLVISGYSAEIIAHHGVLDQGINFIQKPIAMHEVLKKLRIILDAG
jgi:two-component system cell cycle sensor histidine kinase/response regulator CckA